MTPAADIDLLLTSWLAEGADRAPVDRMQAAMLEIEHVGQRRAPFAWLVHGRDGGGRRLLAAAVLAVVLVVGLGVGIGLQAGIIRFPDSEVAPPAPDSSVPPEQPSDPEASPSEGAVEPPDGGSQTFVAPDGSFRIRLADDWVATVGEDPTALYLERADTSISIRGGDEAGTIRPCDTPAGSWETCGSSAPTSLDDLAEAIGFIESGAVLATGADLPRQSTGTLGGEPAVAEWIPLWLPTGTPTRWGFSHVAAMHDGRPFIVRINGPTVGRADPFAAQFLDGFEFVDVAADDELQPEAVDGYRTFVSPDGTFEIRLSEAWRVTSGDDPGALYLRGGALEISIRVGNEDGEIRTCDRPLGAWEACATTDPASNEELAESLGLHESASAVQGPLQWAGMLGGEPAIHRSIVAEGSGAMRAVEYVAAMHQGRPFIVRIAGRTFGSGNGEGNPAGFDAGFLAGFRFTDE